MVLEYLQKIQLLQLWSKVWLNSEGILSPRIQARIMYYSFLYPQRLEGYLAHSKNPVNVCCRTQAEYKAGKGTKTFKETGTPVFGHFFRGSQYI